VSFSSKRNSCRKATETGAYDDHFETQWVGLDPIASLVIVVEAILSFALDTCTVFYFLKETQAPGRV
jgi:hypothetical protein